MHHSSNAHIFLIFNISNNIILRLIIIIIIIIIIIVNEIISKDISYHLTLQWNHNSKVKLYDRLLISYNSLDLFGKMMLLFIACRHIISYMQIIIHTIQHVNIYVCIRINKLKNQNEKNDPFMQFSKWIFKFYQKISKPLLW